jgi:peptidoglycan/xylan/chitin deacetylase (PgdA/CDA1 family)
LQFSSATGPAEGGVVTLEREIRPRGARATARRLALDGLSGLWTALGRTERALSLPRVHFLCLHHLFPDEEDNFRRLLAELCKTHELVSYSEAVRRIHHGEFGRPSVAVSFDDGFKSTLVAGEILREFGASGCFFICPQVIDNEDPGFRAGFCKNRLEAPVQEFLDWGDVQRLRDAGHEIGGHTLSHARLSAAGGRQVRDEAGICADILRRRLGEARHFAWPFGRFWDMTAEAERIVFETGYESCASAERGCHVVSPEPGSRLCLRRENVVAAWPTRHTLYFMAASAARASAADNRAPWTAALRN